MALPDADSGLAEPLCSNGESFARGCARDVVWDGVWGEIWKAPDEFFEFGCGPSAFPDNGDTLSATPFNGRAWGEVVAAFVDERSAEENVGTVERLGRGFADIAGCCGSTP